ncbi:MAG: hypothetical protein KAI17_22795 [Thiotrichaceae bacterium]|nr:hypothetical protein [Thiotrichaceae bacterium]
MSDEMEFDSLSAPAGSLKLPVLGEEYIVRVMKPAASASSYELQISLNRNREMLKESYEAMHETCRDDFFKRVDKKEVDYFSPTQNALVARANMDLLIPLINVKGGIAAYASKLEGMPIEKHIEKLRNKAAKHVREEGTKSRIGGFILMLLILVLATGILMVFF